ncbi:two-component system sensor histidine kinase KdpD [Streptacidiphilus sp. MAP12-20]|uniref:sensor histidine kinase n=1 Tax=Streptacidiphilus sp. MAP12-20 TaxID=3156299 RepID=UPI0035162E15
MPATEPRVHVRTVPGRLKVYLGAAPGVGKTFRMLDEGLRRRDRGTDVVVGFVESHGRKLTEERLDGLEIIPRLTREYRGARFTEMDTDAVLARRPEVVLVDELAHTNIPGGRYNKRWQDVEDLLNAGIDVLTTVNVQHLESLNDVVQKITGVPQRETVPDEVVRRADQIELVDMPPEGLRRRMVHGNVYGPEKVDAALSNYFRVGNLTALRELALLWVAGRVDEGLQRYRAEHGIGGVWETRERVVVALTGGPEGETLIRRAARIAARSAGGDLLAVHVARSDGLADASPAALAVERQLVESIGGSYHSVVGDNIPQALLDFARAENATQLVLGTSRRSLVSRSLTGPGIGETTVELSGDIDVHMVTHEASGRGRHQHPPRAGQPPWRRLGAPVAAVAVPVLLTLVLTTGRSALNLTSESLLLLLGVVGVATLGGVVNALLASVAASLLLNYYFIPPIHRFTIDTANNVLALVAFVVVALVVATIVDQARHLAHRAARATAEAETLSLLTHDVLGGEETIPALLTRLRETFGMDSVTLITRGATGGRTILATDSVAGPADLDAAPRRGAVDEEVAVTDDAALILRGRPLPAADRRVLTAFAAHVRAALDRARLAHAAAEAGPTEAANRTRAALLAAVSHDLRDPLAVASASIGSLRSELTADVPARDRNELLAVAEEALDRLAELADDLHDLSRVHTGALVPRPQATDLPLVLAAVRAELGELGSELTTRGLDAVPPLAADPALLERVLTNLVADALQHSAGGAKIVVAASALADRVEVRVVDHGPSLRAADRGHLFEPFVPPSDTGAPDPDARTGPTLHLALARGFAEAMGATLEPEDTPGGGLTMVLGLPAWREG